MDDETVKADSPRIYFEAEFSLCATRVTEVSGQQELCDLRHSRAWSIANWKTDQ